METTAMNTDAFSIHRLIIIILYINNIKERRKKKKKDIGGRWAFKCSKATI